MHDTAVREKAFLVLVHDHREKWPVEVLTQEFKVLVDSAGIEVVDILIVKLRQINSALYLGKGKVEELAAAVMGADVNVVIFNNNLNARQQHNLEDIFKVKTIDRTQLILDIFARHAHSQEGILQVELAQLQYLLPRLKGKGVEMSRLGGGIGTRGPGEKKLEIDRRRITDRVTRLQGELLRVISQREVMRKKRQKEKTILCSLVGYTSAGKTTLFNALTQANEKTDPSLFTTLDTVARAFEVSDNMSALISDTVGFIHHLPLQLVEAFKATLEELHHSDLLLHVLDASSPDAGLLLDSVNDVLEDLKLSAKPLLLVFNKIDLIGDADLSRLKRDYPDSVFVSALRGDNLVGLKSRIYQVLFPDMAEVVLKFPFSRMEVVADIHQYCQVIKTAYNDDQVLCWVRVPRDKLFYLQKKGLTVNELGRQEI